MQEGPQRDREWEHWPGRKVGDDGIRHRLKALFAATDDEEALEALIVQRGREIEEQTDQLQSTIADLERREEQTSRLRSAVEEMLRHGSAELDERHAELAALAADLAARDERLRAEERDLAIRKQELGAVELRRAAVERREAALVAREEGLERIAAELTDREQALADAEQELARRPGPRMVEAPTQVTHLVYVASASYRQAEYVGADLEVGTGITLEGADFVVARIGTGPRPGDRRMCAYLEPARASS